MQRRNFIFNTIRAVFGKFGFEQIETPAMENLSTLEGKYGEEGDRLLYRVLNSGDVLDAVRKAGDKLRIADMAEKGLRYDLTVPFARYVVMHQNDITFPFRRYQIQPVWRADRPQKGRYREFYQCDADIIGSDSLLNEAELLSIIIEVFQSLGIGISILLNNRKVLAGIADLIGESSRLIEITVALDKLDKIGEDKVKEELRAKGFTNSTIEKLQPAFGITGSANEKISQLKKWLGTSETGMKGIEELETIIALMDEVYPDNKVISPDVTLARGLNYYTGAIIEVKVKDSRSTFSGSICGGGRYDDLTGIFGVPGLSGTGISFGADRIYDVMEEAKLFSAGMDSGTKLLFVNFGDEEASHCLQLARDLRREGISCEVYPDNAKMKKQMSYADQKKIPFVALVGSEEMKQQVVTLKDMKKGEQVKISINELIQKLKR